MTTKICGLLLIGLCCSTLFLDAQLVLDLDDSGVILPEGLYLDELYVTQKSKDAVGVLEVERKDYRGLFLERDVQEQLKFRWRGVQNAEKTQAFRVKVQRLWIGEDISLRPRTGVLIQLHLLFYLEDSRGKYSLAHDFYEFNRASWTTDSFVLGGHLDSLLVKAFNGFVNASSFETSTNLLSSNWEISDYPNGLSNRVLPEILSRDGVIRTWSDAITGVVDTLSTLWRAKKGKGGDAFIFKIKENKGKDVWGVVYEGDLYVHQRWGYQKIDMSKDGRTNVDPEFRIYNSAGLRALMTGSLGSAGVSSLFPLYWTIPYPGVDVGMYRLNRQTGSLDAYASDPDRFFRRNIYLKHSGFSKAEELSISVEGVSFNLRPREYTKCSIPFHRTEKQLTLTMRAGELLHSEAVDRVDLDADDFLVIPKKKSIDIKKVKEEFIDEDDSFMPLDDLLNR